MEKKVLKEIVQEVNKFKLIDIICSVYYFYLAIGDYSNMISTVELEYMINTIYETKSEANRCPSYEEINSVIELTHLILSQSFDEMEKSKDDIIFTQAKEDFLYVKEDTEYSSMVFEYLNLFHPVEYFFKKYYKFKIEDFLRFTNFIQIEYVTRMRLINQILEISHKNITREILIKYLLNCSCNILNFNEATLATNQEELIAFRKILQNFSVDKEECIKNNIENCPIFREGDTYIFSSIVTLLNKGKHIFEKDIRKDKMLRDFYADKKGEYLEILTKDVIKEIIKDAEIFPNIKYRENKHDRECDLLVIYDQIILIIEIKGRTFKEVSKRGSKQYLEQDLNDNIYKAYKQATRYRVF